MDVLQFIANYEKILKDRHIPKMVFYKACGITDAAVSQWRTGKSYPSRKSVESIATFLGITVQSLVGGEETEKPVADEDNELSEMLNKCKDNSALRMVFDAASTLTEDELKTAAALLNALKGSR